MVHYTPLCHDDIFPQEEQLNKLITYEGKSLYTKQNEDGALQVVQLLSTDPQDFLNELYLPGKIISNEFTQQMK